MSELKKDSPVIHVKVTVTTAVNTATGELEYVADYHPGVIPVKEPDTILNFKLHKPTPDDVIISSVTPREPNTQLSTPSISANGKQVTLSDINTVKEALHLKFTFASRKSSATLAASKESVLTVMDGGDHPEILNEPPP